MTRKRFYVPRESIRDGVAILPPGQAHHLRNVLRMESGDPVEIFDGAGSGYAGDVELTGSEILVCNLKSLPSPESPFRLTLAVAMIKPARFEWMLQKATELGVDEIIPLDTRFSQIRIPLDKVQDRLKRWERIVEEAAKQCRRFTVPKVRAPLALPSFLELSEFSTSAKILFYEKALDPWQAELLVSDRIVVCIGPEGGWAQEEVELAVKGGYRSLGLGQLILRAETAAIAAVAIIQHQIALLK